MHNKMNMFVIGRDGQRKELSFDKITQRLQQLSSGLNRVNVHMVALKTINSIYDGIHTSELDTVSSNICSNLATTDFQYNHLGGRILVSNAEKNIKILLGNNDSFVERMNYIQTEYNKLFNRDYLIPDMLKYMNDNKDTLNNMIDYSRNYKFRYFGYKTLEKSYLFKFDDKPVETPQDLFLGIAVAIHYLQSDLDLIKQTYELISNGYFTHATPTLFNARRIGGQNASCFLINTDDSIEAMYDTVKDCALISKGAGGLGLPLSRIRSINSVIKSTNGLSNGIIKYCQVLNPTARHVTQGGKRPGSIAVYLEPWHADVFDWLELKKPTPPDSERCRDLFYALWIPDLFMKAVQENGDWYLMSPDECPGLNKVYGDAFEKLYMQYVSEGKYRKKIKALELWERDLVSKIETGGPYTSFKDTINKRNNQKNIGVIECSNLCNEINEVTDVNVQSVCNLASIAVNRFYENGVYNFDKLVEVAKLITINLNKIIDINIYPTPQSKTTNLSHRPIGVGIQGLADLFCMMKLPFESQEAVDLDAKIMEHIYYGCMSASADLAQRDGSYSYFEGSDFQKGILQFDYSNAKTTLDWDTLKQKVMKGMRNSLLTALMPTASTSQILGNNECFEPYTYNMYIRDTQAGNFIVINEHCIQDLIDIGMWNDNTRQQIMSNSGSIQGIDGIPQNIKELYKTVWEIKQKSIIDHAVARGAFVDQSQSMNLYFPEPDFKKLSSALQYGWMQGLKTGMYYLRSRPASEATKVTLDLKEVEKKEEKKDEKKEDEKKKPKQYVCTEDVCTVCSS
jgi:ribonucleoside-diphosphate reductase subunit M1